MKMLLGFAFAAVLSLPVVAALKAADKAPDFSARASLAGKEFSFSLGFGEVMKPVNALRVEVPQQEHRARRILRPR